MVRLKDVAERAGVSLMTVSKVLRNAPDISLQTKTRIRRLAEEMGYVPDSLAQGLRTRTTKLLGLVISATTNPAASYQATRHLIQLGHKRIAFFAGPAAAPWAQSRSEGYHRAIREAGIDDDDNLIFSAGSTIEDGQKAALEMLNEDVCATAIQAVNDLVAVGAANVFLNQGLKIPQDLSILGFGNVPPAEHFRVPLTTVGQ